MRLSLGSLPAAARTAGAIGVATGVLAACGGNDDFPTNDLPSGVTQQSITVYSATTPGSGTTAATQDLLTGGLGKTGLGLGSRHRPTPIRSTRPRSNCAATRSTPTTARIVDPSAGRRLRRRSTARTSTSTASPRRAKA